MLPVPRQPQALDIGRLLADTRAQPLSPSLTCQGQGHCAGSQIPSVLVGTPGQVMLLHLVRNLVADDRSKVLTPVAQPVANHPEWPGLQPRVVLAHRANPNHWFTFVCVSGVWWRADSALTTIRQEDPFYTNQAFYSAFLHNSLPRQENTDSNQASVFLILV